MLYLQVVSKLHKFGVHNRKKEKENRTRAALQKHATLHQNIAQADTDAAALEVSTYVLATAVAVTTVAKWGVFEIAAAPTGKRCRDTCSQHSNQSISQSVNIPKVCCV